MTTITPRRLIWDVLALLNIIDPGENVDSATEQQVLRLANAMIDSWATEPWTVYTVTRATYTLPANTSLVYIGVGATFNQPRPQRLLGAGYLQPGTSPVTETPIVVLTQEAYQAISTKTQTNTLPVAVFYNPTDVTGWGSLQYWQIPTQSLTVTLYYEQALAQFADLTTDIILPPGYLIGIEYQLARLVATWFSVPLPEIVVQEGERFLSNLKRANLRILSLPNAFGYLGAGIYDINTDVVKTAV